MASISKNQIFGSHAPSGELNSPAPVELQPQIDPKSPVLFWVGMIAMLAAWRYLYEIS